MFRLLFLVIIFISCKTPKSHLVGSFDSMYNDLRLLKFENIKDYLDEDSKELYEKLTNVDNFNIAKLKEIGDEYQIQYFCAGLYGHFGLDQGNVEPHDFFKYLIVNQIYFFDYKILRMSNQEKSIVGEDNLVAIYHDEYRKRKFDWVKYTCENPKEYKYNLIYTLQQMELFYSDLTGIPNDSLDNDTCIDYYKLAATTKQSINDVELWRKIAELEE